MEIEIENPKLWVYLHLPVKIVKVIIDIKDARPESIKTPIPGLIKKVCDRDMGVMKCNQPKFAA